MEKPISPTMHGALDYSTIAATAAAPKLLDFPPFFLKVKLSVARIIQRAGDLETTALGAAFLAGLAVGFWKDLEELKESYEPGKIFQTQMPEERREELYAGWKKAVNATRAFK